MASPRVVVFGYGGFGCAGIDALVRAGATIVAGVSHQDDPRETRWWSSVPERIAAIGAPCVLDPDMRAVDATSMYARLRALEPDFLFSFYYRKMLPERVLALAHQGAYNLHGSLLPRFRGRAPINWQLVQGEPRSGLTLHRMVRSADAGDIVAQVATAVDPDEDAYALTRRLLDLAPAMLAEVLPALFDGTAVHRPQDHRQATVFGGRTPADGLIDWRWDARRVHNLVRAVAPPWPGAFTFLHGARVHLDRTRVVAEHGSIAPPGQVLADGVVACGAGSVQVLTCGDAARQPMTLAPGMCFDIGATAVVEKGSP